MKFPKGTVVYDNVRKEKIVIGCRFAPNLQPEDDLDENRYTKVCDHPHEDGSFSYICGKDWCRCMQ